MTAPDDVTPEAIAALLRLEAEATPGPWRNGDGAVWDGVDYDMTCRCNGECYCCDEARGHVCEVGKHQDAALIVAARNAIAPLCHALTKAWVERDAANDMTRAYKEHVITLRNAASKTLDENKRLTKERDKAAGLGVKEEAAHVRAVLRAGLQRAGSERLAKELDEAQAENERLRELLGNVCVAAEAVDISTRHPRPNVAEWQALDAAYEEGKKYLTYGDEGETGGGA